MTKGVTVFQKDGSSQFIECVPGKTHDQFHDFDELYKMRCLLFIGLMKAHPSISWRANNHFDGSGYSGWFIAGMQLPTGQITYHLPDEMWELIDGAGIQTSNCAPFEWDGHTSEDVVHRLKEFLVTEVQPISTKSKKKSKVKPKPTFGLKELKAAVYNYFEVADTAKLKKNPRFKMACDGLDINLKQEESWKVLYRRLIGVIPGEENNNPTEYGVINGVDIFKYNLPWDVFGLEPGKTSIEEVKAAYRSLSKTYHPDNRETGSADIFDRLNTFYQTLLSAFE